MCIRDRHYTLSGLSEGTYKFVEVACEGNYILDATPHSIYVEPGSTMTIPYELTVINHRKLGLEILKLDVYKRQVPSSLAAPSRIM